MSIIMVFYLLNNIHPITEKEKDIQDFIVSIKNYDELDIKEGYHYFGSPSCLTCKEFQKILEKEIVKQGQIIYYVNTQFWKNKEPDFGNFMVEMNIDEVPLIIHYNNDIEIRRFYYSDEEIDAFLKGE